MTVNILCILFLILFHISSKAPLPTQFSRHILCCVFDQSPKLQLCFKINNLISLSVVSRINYLHVY